MIGLIASLAMALEGLCPVTTLISSKHQERGASIACKLERCLNELTALRLGDQGVESTRAPRRAC